IKSCVTLNDSKSGFFASHTGLRQGENLSPLLFSIFLNDLETYLQAKTNGGIELELCTDEIYFYTKLVVLLYADDIVIIADSPEKLQHSLNGFVTYCKSWKLNINYDKTKIVVFGSRNIDKLVFEMEGNNIEIVKNYKYLGVIMSNNGSFLSARKCVYEKANKAMHLLYKRINNLNLPLDLQLKLFDKTILPIISYGCEIWGFENLQMFERIHNSFLRTIIKCKKSTPLYMLYREMGRYPIEITIKAKIIGFCTRIVTGSQLKLVNLLYQKLLFIGGQKFKWIRNMQSIFQEVGRYDIWLKQHENLSTNLHHKVKKILIDQFIQKWHQSLNESSKGRNYSFIKSDPEFEEYLTILPRSKYFH
ncbi:MAG: reverse transcriptase domain-containing protein, partial [Candidatus Thiodiazotropha taylori]